MSGQREETMRIMGEVKRFYEGVGKVFEPEPEITEARREQWHEFLEAERRARTDVRCWGCGRTGIVFERCPHGIPKCPPLRRAKGNDP
jgi:hypothetical protein